MVVRLYYPHKSFVYPRKPARRSPAVRIFWILPLVRGVGGGGVCRCRWWRRSLRSAPPKGIAGAPPTAGTRHRNTKAMRVPKAPAAPPPRPSPPFLLPLVVVALMLLVVTVYSNTAACATLDVEERLPQRPWAGTETDSESNSTFVLLTSPPPPPRPRRPGSTNLTTLPSGVGPHYRVPCRFAPDGTRICLSEKGQDCDHPSELLRSLQLRDRPPSQPLLSQTQQPRTLCLTTD